MVKISALADEFEYVVNRDPNDTNKLPREEVFRIDT